MTSEFSGLTGGLSESSDATDSATEANQRFALSLAMISGQVGGPYGQALNQMSAMMAAVDEDGKRTFTNTEAAVAGFGAALAVAGSEMGGYGGIAVETLGNVASALAKGDWIGAAIAGLTGIGKALDRAFNGAQMAMNDLSDAVTASFDAIISGSLTAAEAFDKATNWEGNEEGYERLRGMQQLWLDAGLGAEQATAWQERYNAAVAAQDHASILRLLEELEEVGEAARLAGEAQAEAARLAAEAQARLDKAISATMSAYFRAKDAGVEAYDKVFEAAIASGATQQEATKLAETAQLKAAAKVLREERKKFVQLARFEAILAEIRSR